MVRHVNGVGSDQVVPRTFAVDLARDLFDVVAERAHVFVVFAGEPEDAVAVENAPDGGEGVAEAEVDAADVARRALD